MNAYQPPIASACKQWHIFGLCTAELREELHVSLTIRAMLLGIKSVPVASAQQTMQLLLDYGMK